MAWSILATFLGLTLPSMFSQPAESQAGAASAQKSKEKGKKKKKSEKGWHFTMKKQPSLRHSDRFQADFRVKLQGDFESVDPQQEDLPLFDMRRKRVGVEGTFFRDFEYEFEWELGVERNALRDGFVNFRRLRYLQFQGGKFRLPFGRDTLTGMNRLDFVFRSRIGALIGPARDLGLMLHGPVWDRKFRYEFGVFRHDGENAFTGADRPTGERTIAGRIRSEPKRYLPLPKIMETLEIAAAFTRGNVPEGRNSLRGRTTYDKNYFPRIDVNGNRTRLGAEFSWQPGPFSLQAEASQVRDQRLNQSFRQTDLPDVIGRGWYVFGTWLLTGEQKAGGVRPRKPLTFDQLGWGAVEIAVRNEFLRFGSMESAGREIASPRAANLLRSSNRAWTFGLNWYVNRYVKIQGNFVRERIEDFNRSSPDLRSVFWNRTVRLQFVM
jgi:phosphate-selective porin OprO/OprP